MGLKKPIIASKRGAWPRDIILEQDHASEHPEMITRILPQAVSLEEAVLRAIMVDGNGMGAVIEVLKVESFYKEVHGVTKGNCASDIEDSR